MRSTHREMAKARYPETTLLKQVKGVGDLIATINVLTLEDPHRFRKGRDAGCFVGLQPGRRNSGESEPQMHISKRRRRVSADVKNISEIRGYKLGASDTGVDFSLSNLLISSSHLSGFFLVAYGFPRFE